MIKCKQVRAKSGICPYLNSISKLIQSKKDENWNIKIYG